MYRPRASQHTSGVKRSSGGRSIARRATDAAGASGTTHITARS
jgi:hypothetical protein